MNPNKEIADTILAQLGGRRFALMTGAKNFGFVNNGLRFNLSKSSTRNKCDRVTIRLDHATDTYTMTFEKVNMKNLCVDTIKSVDMVYCDMLQDVFTSNTGLYTSLT